MTKNKPYVGVLNEPIRRLLKPSDRTPRVPKWWSMQGQDPRCWPLVVEAEASIARAQFVARVEALFRFFAIDGSAPGAWLDLALSLALRHERDFVENDRAQFSRLFARYKSSSLGSDPCVDLALRLAQNYVKGFNEHWPSIKRGTLVSKGSVGEFRSKPVLDFLMIYLRIEEYLLRTRKRQPTPRRIAAAFASPTELYTISPIIGKNARILREEFGRTGKLLSASAIEKLIIQARTARECFIRGDSTGFQNQIICEVADMVDKLSDVDDIND